MDEPYLVFIGETGGVPTKGRCSACRKVLSITWTDGGVAQKHFSNLEKVFRDHVREVHMRENTSQSAAPIMKKGTERSSK